MYLNQNIIGTDGGASLKVNLKYLRNLVTIDLSSNTIGKIGGEIFETLSNLPVLSSIDISGIGLEDDQIIFIFENIHKLVFLDTIVFDMTLSNDILRDLKKNVPDYCHIYKENPIDGVTIEIT